MSEEKDTGVQVPTFQQNMHQLYNIKQQLLCIKHMFSPDAINYQQLQLISELRQQVQQSQKQVTHLHNFVKATSKSSEEQLAKLEKERKQLQDVNIELVGYNDKLVAQLEATSNKLYVWAYSRETMAAELEKQRQLRKDLQSKFSRQIQNVKLMHSQQLYILRKKDKKSNP